MPELINLVTCPDCGGDGYTVRSEHSHDPGTHTPEGECLGYCPVPVQDPCVSCGGTGQVPEPSP